MYIWSISFAYTTLSWNRPQVTPNEDNSNVDAAQTVDAELSRLDLQQRNRCTSECRAAIKAQRALYEGESRMCRTKQDALRCAQFYPTETFETKPDVPAFMSPLSAKICH
jgi:hypothetical protein